ncbi:30S ribosomal protein S8 [Lactobacillus delbrueckii]|uniref:30S ribosomal protein S8 n=1 Tax=Lactobacillus delbrueckii TaxID=1584 RepID=UPI0023639867|nr:30S ribosomal protein S8 [Lactobacillus delbrueckii]MDD1332470.1 30S ribosomal protein S8 [Lactobacillus delbrueckii subsp. lactis]
MVLTDPIADFLTRIRNANMAKHDSVEIPASNIKKSLTEILKQEGFIRDYEVTEDGKQGVIKITLKYGPNGERVISGLKRISKPGLRNYVSAYNLPKVLNGLGIAIVSTSAGILTDKEAREKNVGGEVIAYVW